MSFSRRALVGAAITGAASFEGSKAHTAERSLTNAAANVITGASSVVNVKTNFGAVGDGRTDDTTAIQSAIDFALNNRHGTVFLPEGTYKVTKTLHLGYGWQGSTGSYNTIALEGATGFSGGAYGGENQTKIVATFKDRPIINIQGGRVSGLRKLWIAGPTQVNGTGYSALQRADPMNYVPELAVDNRRSPFCGVCIDGYSGTSPDVPYPSPTYPNFVGKTSGAYGKNLSSSVFVRDCYIQDCLIGIMQQPNLDGNGDFSDFSGTMIQGCKVGVAVGNTQARSTNYRNMRFQSVHTCIDGVSYGSRCGNVHGAMDNIHADYCYQLLAYNGNWSKPVVVTNFYSEVMSRIGYMVTGNSTEFIGCHFDNLDASPNALTYARIEPIWSGGRAAFRNCEFVGFHSASHFDADATFAGCLWQRGSSSIPSGHEATALYALFGGVLVNFQIPSRRRRRSRFEACRIVTGSYDGADNTEVSCYHSYGADEIGPISYLIPTEIRADLINIQNITWSGRSFSGQPNVTDCKSGDVIYDNTTRCWFYLREASSFSVTGVALTNYTWDGATYAMLVATGINMTSASWFPKNIFDISTSTSRFFETVAGSATVNYVDENGTPSTIPQTITTDSKVLWHKGNNHLGKATPFPRGTAVSAVRAQTLEMTQKALTTGTWLVGPGIAKLK